MRSYEHRIDIDASPAIVWAQTIDVESWPQMFPTVTSVERLDDGPLRVGSRARIKQPGQPHRVWTVATIEPEHRFVWTTQANGFAMMGAHVLTPTTVGGTVNHLMIDVDGPLARLVAALAGRKLRKTLAIENEGFRTAARASEPVGRLRRVGRFERLDLVGRQ